MKRKVLLLLLLICATLAAGRAQSASESGSWLSWRGPLQNGCSEEAGLPESVNLDELAWTYEIAGRGTPVIGGGRVYFLGYDGEGAEFQERLICVDEESGRELWRHDFVDFLSDVIYYRFAISSPTIDAQTGNVYAMSTSGQLMAFTKDGELLWERSTMSEIGRLTFPNGRTIAPVIVGDLVITHIVTSAWGKDSPARDRFYAFDKRSGESAWSSMPGGPPKDTSFSYPVIAKENGRTVLYAGLAGGHMVSVDAQSGDPLWRFQMSVGGMSSSPVVYGDSLIAIHGKENLDGSKIGRMISLKRGSQPQGQGKASTLGKDSELWRNDLCAFTSSPVLVGNRVYQTVLTGDLFCIDADSGKTLWHTKLAPDQIHASPAWGDGKLYVPMNNGTLHILRPSDEGPGLLQTIQLEGNCLAAPAIANGRVYVHTTKRLYRFGSRKATRLQLRPGDVLAKAGSSIRYHARSMDALSNTVNAKVSGLKITGLPEGLSIGEDGLLAIPVDVSPWAGVIKAEAEGVMGTARLRIVPALPIALNFNDTKLAPHPKSGEVVAAPPAWFAGANRKWDLRELDGNKVIAKTLDMPLFQRTQSFIGHPDMSGYTIEADVRTDGNRRSMSSVGLLNQRYLIRLKGNHQTLEISSNMELFRKEVKFRWKAKKWYRLKTRVDVQPDGSGVIRAKAWPRGDDEPEAWTLEVEHPHAHKNGSPGIYGFTPQSRFRVYIDNIQVTSNEN